MQVIDRIDFGLVALAAVEHVCRRAKLAIGTALVVAISEIPFVGIMAMISAWFLVFGAVRRSRGGQAIPAQQDPPSTIVPTTGV